MNINLVYEGKNYNFDIPNDVTIDYNTSDIYYLKKYHFLNRFLIYLIK